MEYYDLIRSRESVRNYDPNKPVPKEILERILDAGRLAPSGYPKSDYKKNLSKKRKFLKDIVEFL